MLWVSGGCGAWVTTTPIWMLDANGSGSDKLRVLRLWDSLVKLVREIPLLHMLQVWQEPAEAPGEWQQLTAPLLLGVHKGLQVAAKWHAESHVHTLVGQKDFVLCPPPHPRLKVIGGNDRLARAGGGILEGCTFSLCLKMIQAYSWRWHSACTSLKMGWTRDLTLVFKNKLLDGERRVHRVAWRLTGPPGHWGQ